MRGPNPWKAHGAYLYAFAIGFGLMAIFVYGPCLFGGYCPK